MSKNLRAQLISRQVFGPSEVIALTFSLTNLGEKDIYVLTWHTPIDGLWSDCFRVIHNGSRVPYDGPLAKRGWPGINSFVRLSAGASISAEVDLSSAYDLRVQGKYEVAIDTFVLVFESVDQDDELRFFLDSDSKAHVSQRLSSPISVFYVDAGSERVTFGEYNRSVIAFDEEGGRRRDETGGGESVGAVAPQFKGGTADQQEKVRQAHFVGYNLVTRALGALANDCTYKYWFGGYSDMRFQLVGSVLRNTQVGFELKVFTYDLTGDGCKSDMFAYTSKGGHVIWICGLFWRAQPEGADSQAGSVLHEHSHASASTEDSKIYGSGEAAAHKLALDYPDDAVRNANNYEYFAGG